MSLRSLIALLFAFLISVGAAAGENQQKILPLSSDVYRALDSIYLEAGEAPPFASRPYTVQEAADALAAIDRSRLSPAGRRAYDEVKAALSHRTLTHGDPGFQFDTHPVVTVAGYLQSNPAAQDNSSEPAWVKRPPLLNIPLELWLFNGLYADFEVPLMLDPFVAQQPSGYSAPTGFTPNPTNLPLAANQIYAEVPYRAFISYGGNHWNLELGRDTIAWGNGPFGNLGLSNNTDYYDLLRFTTYWRDFKFTAAYIDLPPYYHSATGGLGANLIASNVPNKGPLMTKLLVSHRIEFRILRKATLALSEVMAIGGIGAPLTYLNPLMIFHNWNIWEVGNDNATAELSITPYRWLDLFGQLAVNQVGGKIEPYAGSQNTPTALGLLAGARGSYPIGPGYLDASFQWTRTDPWFYIGGRPGMGALPWLTLDAERRYLSNFLSADPVIAVPVGWQYGPDSLVIDASLAYQRTGSYRAGVELRLQQQGTNTITTPHAYGLAAAELATPSGAYPITTRVVHLFGSWTVGRYFGVGTALGGDLSFIDVKNVNHDASRTSFNVQFDTKVTLTF